MEKIVTKNCVKNLKNVLKISGIYKIVNPKGKVYIGQSVDLYRRLKHYFEPKSAKNQTILKNSFQKYDVNKHIFSIIEECDIEELNERERYWQEFYLELTLNCRITQSSDKSGYCSDITKINISNGLKLSGKSYQHFKKKIYQYSTDGLFIKEFESLRDAARFLNCNISTISKSIKKDSKNKSACGFLWSYDKLIKHEGSFGQNTICILQCNINGDSLKKWASICLAARELKLSKSGIIRCCKGKQKQCGGFTFKYITNENI